MEAVINFVVVKDDGCSNSDHLPVRCELLLDIGQSAPSVDGSTDGDMTQSTHMKQSTYVKPKWTDPLFVATYTHNLRQELSKIPPLEPHRVDRANAQCVIDLHTNLINRAMHSATRAGLSLVTPRGKTKRRVHWWTSDCTMARNRTRLFFHIWKELGRPKYGAARKAYNKTTCRSAVNSVVHTNHRKLSRILACKRTGQFWNEVNRANIAANERQECNISLDTLEEYFRDKFDVKEDQNSELVTKYEQLQHREYQVDISEHKIKKYILQLKSGKAVGADDISSEHYKYALDTNLPLHLSSILTLCLRYGTIPETFLHGILIPIYKKGKDPGAGSSYRPVNLSVVMTKILEVCQTHTPHPAQFGFVFGRGTYMAISLAHDVMAYFNDSGSAVYTCSLDAEGAFDAIPHVVIFGKLDGIVPDYDWRVMYAWYRQMYFTIRLHGALGQRLPVRRGTRQGGLSSPWIFNVFYGDLIDTISKSDRGISLRGETYSVFCYADDLLIASTTSTGLQALIDICDSYISQHGLRFNPQKTSCTTVGKHRLVSQPKWTIKGHQLKITDTFSYLGAVFGNGGSAEHVNQRIRAAKNAHRSLQAAGLHANGLDTLAAMHVYSLGVQPCLNYGAHAIDLSTTELLALDTTHSNLIKWSLGLSKLCRSTPLLRALGVQRIPAMRDHQSVNLLKRCLAGSSAASTFYWSLIHNRDIDVTRTLVNKLNLVDNSIYRVLFGNTRRLLYDIGNDGLSDSVRFLLHNMNNDNFRILQNILCVDF